MRAYSKRREIQEDLFRGCVSSKDKKKWGNNGATSLMFLEGECRTGGVGVDRLKTSETCMSLIDKLPNTPIRDDVYQETSRFCNMTHSLKFKHGHRLISILHMIV